MNQTLKMIIDALLELIQAACADYFRWTHGRVLYDDGVEALMHVYAAKGIYNRLSNNADVIVRMERPIKEMIPEKSGRIDLSIEIAGSFTIAIEFKRYLNDAVIDGDLQRLATIAALPGHKAILAAPGFIRQGATDWLAVFAADISARNPTYQTCLSEVAFLPSEYVNLAGRDRSRAIAIIVPPNPMPLPPVPV